jgi:hypothetical protein
VRRSAFALLLCLFPASSCDCGGDLLEASKKLVVEPAAIDFGEVGVGDLRVRSVKLQNLGIASLAIERLEIEAATGEFAFASPLPDALVPSAMLELNLVFQPVDVGEERAVLVIRGDDGTGDHRVDLVGVGVIGDLSITHDGVPCGQEPDSIDFGDVTPGSVATHTITISAIGSDEVTILSAILEPGVTAEFEIDGPASPEVLMPGMTFTMDARYRPADGGRDQGAFVITTSLPSAPSIRIPVCGAGIAPAVCGRPIPLDLGLVPEGGSATGTLTLESCGLQPLDITAIALSMDAGYATDPGFAIDLLPPLPSAMLEPGQTVEVTIRYTASSLGPKEGHLRVDSTAYGLPVAYFPMEATVARPCDVVVAPVALTFAGIAAGATDRRSVLVANNGASSCEITRLDIAPGPFTVAASPGLPFSVASGDSAIVEVEYAPPDPGPHTSTLEVEASGLVTTVDLYGNPPEIDDCVVELVPTVVNFGVTSVGATAHRSIAVRAIGGQPCRIRGARLLFAEPAFTVTAPAIGIIFPMADGNVDVAYAPPAPGAHFDVVEIEVAAVPMGASTFHTVGLSGSAAEADICVMPTELHFGTVTAGTVGTRTVSISSCGAGSLELRGIVKSPGTPPEFRIASGPAVPQTLAGGTTASPALTIEYAPTGPGPHFGQIDVLSSDTDLPSVPILLTGNWDQSCAQVLECTPGTVDFGATDIGVTKTKTVVCRNAGTLPVTISSASLAGAPASMMLVATTPVTLARGDLWSAEVRFSPLTAGATSATLNLASDACRGPPGIPVAGLGQDVVLPPCTPPSTFTPAIEWEWHGSSIEPASNNVWATPVVVNLTDDDGDGRIDENDVAEVIVTTFDTISLSDPTASQPGVLRILSGDTGLERLSVTSVRLAESGQLAVGDLDADGVPEIIGSKWVQTPPGTGTGNFESRYITGNLVAIDPAGNVKWVSDPWSWPPFVLWNAASPFLADLDGDGFSEIILGREVFDHQGRIVWRGTGSHGLTAGAGPQSVVADIDLDGSPEVLAGDTAYRADGSIFWRATHNGFPIGEGGVSVGMLDPSDPYPQIALFTGAVLYAVDHLGNVVWERTPNGGGATAALPVIADFDGDGDPDIAVANGMAHTAYTGTGGDIFTGPVMDDTCCAGISAFDFEGDGVSELVLTDFGNIYAYRGNTGALIYTAGRLNPTNLEIPVMADIDNDRKAELLVSFFDQLGGTGGLVAFSNTGDNWVAAPRVFNQQAYHVTNVGENGAIPRIMTPVPQAPPVYRATIAACE